MNKKLLAITGGTIIVTIFFFITYLSFNVLGISQSKVKRYELTLVSQGLEKVYDGTPLSSDLWLLESGELNEGDTMTITMGSSITEPGTIKNEIGVTIMDITNKNVTENYKLTLKQGDLTILPRELTIETDSVEKVYDGNPLTNDTWNLLDGIMLEGHRIEYVMGSSITNPGTTDNVIGITIFDDQDQVVTHCYNIEYIFGTLTVHAIDLTVGTGSLQKIYDGTPATSDHWEILDGIILPNHHIEYTMGSTITLPNSIDNEIIITIYDDQNHDVTIGYDIEYVLGELAILPRELLIQTESLEKDYDGTPLFSEVWRILSGSLANGHRIEAVMESEITDPGSIDNTITITIYDGENLAVNDCYEIEFMVGSLTIHGIDLYIRTETVDKLYDGLPLVSTSWTLQNGTLLVGHHIDFVMNSSITTPGSIENAIEITILDQNNQIVTEKYRLIYDLGSLTIRPISLDIITENKSKFFDGLALTSQTWSIESGTLLENHYLEFVMSSTITGPGTIENGIAITVKDHQNRNVTNLYDINFTFGSLTVYTREITIGTENSVKNYDGIALTSQGWTLISGILAANHHIEPVMTSSITLPGTVLNTIGISILDESDNDMSFGYEITFDFGSLTINPIPIILKSASATKVYDGLPLVADHWEFVYGTLLPGHTIVVDVDGEITDVGSIDNLFFAYVIDELGNNVTSFYVFQYNYGELSVLTSTYGSGDLSTEGFEPSDEEVLKIFSTQKEAIYLKDVSYGSYTKKGWTPGTQQTLGILINPLSFASIALQESGKSSLLLQIEYLRAQVPYLLPYYTIDFLSGYNDVHIFGSTTGIVDYNRIAYGYNDVDTIYLQDTQISDQELLYRNYVYSTYLSMPESTRQAMLSIISANGINPLSTTLISDVKEYISNAATYNLKFAPIPIDVEDIAIYFLTVSKEGICQHFATAGVLMYRALGIPARYVTGYLGMSEANTWTTVTGKFAHAWVEVYIDGFGWMPVEVTGGGPGGDAEGDGGGGGGGGEPEEPLIEISVTPRTVKEIYVPGKVITASSVIISGFSTYAALGYTYQVQFEGELSVPGIAASSVVSFIIYDALDVDVTDKFDIQFKNGILQLYQYTLSLYTSSSNKIYDGTPLSNNSWYYNGPLGAGHYVQNIEFLGLQTNVGTSKNRTKITIFDELGNDVTGEYNITNYFGNLTVTPRIISIESSSLSKVFDGTPLIDHTYRFISGSLANSESITVVITGSQVAVGRSVNTIESVTVMNSGVDVTNNYSIDIIEGELTVTPNI